MNTSTPEPAELAKILLPDFKRTKILASLGPATDSPEMIKKILKAGVNGIRLNFSHGTHEEHKIRLQRSRAMAKELDKPVSVVQDLQGPKIRIGQLPDAGIELKKGDIVKLGFGVDYEESGIIPVQHDIGAKMKKGETIYIVDGKYRLTVKSIRHSVITAEVHEGGMLHSRKGMNLPDTDFGGDVLTPKDLADLDWGAKEDIDYIAMSFVQTADDIKRLRKEIDKRGAEHVKIIAKIETNAAIDNIEDIVLESDGVMVARGDLAIEAGPEVVPIVQRKIIGLCRQYGKFAIVATQMLGTMVHSAQPSRAEVSDVATAVIIGADCLMLSDETTIGQYPEETIAMMKKTILYAQSHSPLEPLYMNLNDTSKSSAIASAAITLAHQMGAKAIVAATATGRTARNIAAHRPKMPIAMATDNQRVANQLAIVYGGLAQTVKKPKGGVDEVAAYLHKRGALKKGDYIVQTYGGQAKVPGGTDTIKVRLIEN